MGKTRVEAFSDAVIAIIMTIMVLEMKVPHGTDLESLKPIVPVFLSYVLSFTYLGIYWNNHHHLLHATHRINGKMLWANIHLLFWLSLVPFATGWMGENHFAPVPVALYGVVLLLSAVAYYILKETICREPANQKLADAMGGDFKGKVSAVIYAIAVPLAFVHELIAGLAYVAVALWWLVPDRRIEGKIHE
jgi:uncharacterized membrane protein